MLDAARLVSLAAFDEPCAPTPAHAAIEIAATTAFHRHCMMLPPRRCALIDPARRAALP
jgi:hypothetical protein